MSAAQADPRITGAAHLGSAAADRLDVWSDIDLALCISADFQLEEAVSEWTSRMYDEHRAVTHCDVKRGETLYRVFLLHNTLQVDLSFWPASQFRAVGPKFKLIFGIAKEPQPSPASNPSDLIGMAWLYALHARSSIARHRVLQAEYMLSNMRNNVLSLVCLRYGLPFREGRGFDDLVDEQKKRFAQCYPSLLAPEELRRALHKTMDVLLIEIRTSDSGLAERIGPTLNEIAHCVTD